MYSHPWSLALCGLVQLYCVITPNLAWQYELCFELCLWAVVRAIYWKVDISWHFYFFQSWNPPFLVFYIADLTRFYIAKIHWNSLKLINKLPFTIFRAMTNPEAAKFLSVCQSKTTILLYLHFNLLLLLCFIIFVLMKSKKKKII